MQPAFESLKANAAQAADFLLLLANDRRLMILCELKQAGEMPVGALADAVGLSQSALSQHLARLRADGLVETRREGQTIHYRLARDPRVTRTLSLLKQLFCP
ncbi:MAG: winged helix-turn-helix transcriptional regulator [Alphaproteobacteria bacterium]|nr:winged helix-turn-helix transcriptional regulator [Alphaproteobacteria bacterium]